jgi:hypothetical protein
MKKVLAILLFLPFAVKAQDSVKHVVAMQARTVRYIGGVADKERDEPWFDVFKASFRVPIASLPDGVTIVTSDSIRVIDLFNLYADINQDALAIKRGHKARFEAALRGLNNAFLTAKLDALDTADASKDIERQTRGVVRYRRQ